MGQRVLDATGHMGWASDAHMKMVVVRKGSMRLKHDVSCAKSKAEGRADPFRVREKPGAKRGRNKDVGHMSLGIVQDGC